VREGEREERLSPVKNRFLKEEWGPSKAFIERLVESKAHIDHTMTAELAKYQARIWDLETEREGLAQQLARVQAEQAQDRAHLTAELATYKALLLQADSDKAAALTRRNEAVRAEIERILAGHQEAIVYYEMQREEFERQLAARDARIEELGRELGASKGDGNKLEQDRKELNEQLAHSNEIKDQLRTTIKQNQEYFDKELGQTRAHYEDKI
jgi:chromosome segregation ATPase